MQDGDVGDLVTTGGATQQLVIEDSLASAVAASAADHSAATHIQLTSPLSHDSGHDQDTQHQIGESYSLQILCHYDTFLCFY